MSSTSWLQTMRGRRQLELLQAHCARQIASKALTDLEVEASHVDCQGIHLSSCPSMVFLPEFTLVRDFVVRKQSGPNLSAFVSEVYLRSSSPERSGPSQSCKSLPVTAGGRTLSNCLQRVWLRDSRHPPGATCRATLPRCKRGVKHLLLQV